MKAFLKKYRHAWLILTYFPIYFLWFVLLEQHVTENYFIIRSPLDAYIPFLEIFIVPYLLWFPFIAVSILYFIFRDKTEYYRLCGVLITGMTVFLLVSTIFPNGVALRPVLADLGRNNIFLDLVASLHRADTSTNVCPSIHVYNSLAVCVAFFCFVSLKRKIHDKNGHPDSDDFDLFVHRLFKTTFRHRCLLGLRTDGSCCSGILCATPFKKRTSRTNGFRIVFS